MLSIGTLLAYTVVAISITILRFSNRSEGFCESSEPSSSVKAKKQSIFSSSLLQIFNCRALQRPTRLSSRIVGAMIFLYTVFSLVLCLLILYSKKDLAAGHVWPIVVWCVICSVLLLTQISIAVQPRDSTEAPFKVPLVPIVPGISIFINIYLMLMLDAYTWIFFSIWLVIGFILYTCYGFRNSLRLSEMEPLLRSSNNRFKIYSV
uniref:Putative cationic amino acid transporter n=1 Tax=Phlebotomus kandelakii TaxID=1109342 RepID=A0A6B2E5M5_9DIPT